MVGERVDVLEPNVMAMRTRISIAAGSVTGACASTKFSAFSPSTTSLWRIRKRSRGDHCVLGRVLDALAARQDHPELALGVSRLEDPASVVTLEPSQIIRYFSLRVEPTATQ